MTHIEHCSDIFPTSQEEWEHIEKNTIDSSKDEFDVSQYNIELMSFRLGEFKFDGSNWSCNDLFTKNPPNDGTCRVFHRGKLVFVGDWRIVLNDFGLTPESFKTW